MKRVLVGILAALLSVGVTSGVHAEKKKSGETGAKADKPEKSAKVDKKAKKKGGKGKDAAPQSAKISEAMTGLKWGMSRDDLIKASVTKIKEKYRPLIAKTKDAVEEDRLRQEARQELDAIKKGTVDFDGKSTGWDVSFLKGEFTQNNSESMLVVRDANSQNFYFFIEGKLWKWYKAFDAAVFPADNFGVFSATLQKKFGDGKPGEAGKRKWLQWQDKTTQLRAVDETDFYGFYCLVFEEKATVDQLAKLRTNSSDEGSGKKHAFVEAVTAERTENPDDSANIADRISGRIRHREDAAEAPSSSPSASAKGKSGKKGETDDEERGVANSDDPISGLGL
jgi:hypothetical protein